MERGSVQREPEFNVLLVSYIPYYIRYFKSGFFKMYCNTEVYEIRTSQVHNIRLFSFRNVTVSIKPSRIWMREIL